MDTSLPRALRFLLERWIQRGVLHQLLLMAAMVVAVAVTGGLFAFTLTDGFGHLGEAVWWAFLRLTDPGYLGDDEGATLRVISTAVTVAGYVIFMGSLIAILTQWLAVQLRQLEAGLTPITMRGHVVILGWTNRTPELVLKLLTARGRLRRFLERMDARRLNVVILAPEVDAELRLALRDHLGEHWNDSQVLLRTGSSLQPDHLRRLDVSRAATVVIPGADFQDGGSEGSDTRVVKTLLTLDGIFREDEVERRPSVVAEVFDPQRAELARHAAGEGVEVLPSALLIARLVTQIVRHPGLAPVVDSLLSHTEGNSIYVRAFPEFVGRRPVDVQGRFPRAIVLGRVTPGPGGFRCDMDLAGEAVLAAEESLILLAEAFDQAVPEDGAPDAGASGPAPTSAAAAPTPPAGDGVQRLLVLGWSHKLGAILNELERCPHGRYEVTAVSRLPVEERERWLERLDLGGTRVTVTHVVGDYALERDLRRLDLGAFDDVVMLASDFAASSEQADARTILGRVQLRPVLEALPARPRVLMELLDPDNEHLFRDPGDVTLVTPAQLSFLLAHVSFRPELACVYDEILRTGGQELEVWDPRALGLEGGPVRFPEVQRAALARRATALGVRLGGTWHLNPDRSRDLALGDDDLVVVLRTVDGAP